MTAGSVTPDEMKQLDCHVIAAWDPETRAAETEGVGGEIKGRGRRGGRKGRVWVGGKDKAEEMVGKKGKEKGRLREGKGRGKQTADCSKSRIFILGKIKWMAKQGIGQAVGYQILYNIL